MPQIKQKFQYIFMILKTQLELIKYLELSD